MNSKVVKFVAGAGKTTYSAKILKDYPNGLYLAFNNSVVDSIEQKGYLARTIDGLFQSFIIPKFVGMIPIIANGSTIKYEKSENVTGYLKNAFNIKILPNGEICYKTTKTPFSLNTPNSRLYRSSDEKYTYALRQLFGKQTFMITDELRSGISEYLITKYPKQIVDIISRRFSYVIFDESQDLNKHKEAFARLLFESNIPVIVLGDDNQNINGGGPWFQNLEPTEIKNQSFRCPETNCEWIRQKIGIEIYGNESKSSFNCINLNDAMGYDDGKRVLLFKGRVGTLANVVDSWKGPKKTIQSSKGDTIEADIVIIGKSLNKKLYYTAITRTTRNVFTTIERIAE